MSSIRTLPALAREMTAVVDRCTDMRARIEGSVDAMARFLPNALRTELAELPPGEKKYARHLVHCDPDNRFSLLALVWRPGQGTPIHDHPSWGVLGVARGRMKFTNYGVDEIAGKRRLVPIEIFIGGPGSVGTVFPPHVDVHRMENCDDEELAITLHCYGCEVRQFHVYAQETAERRLETSKYDSELSLSLR